MGQCGAARAKVKGLLTSDMNKYTSKTSETIDMETNTAMAGKTYVECR